MLILPEIHSRRSKLRGISEHLAINKKQFERFIDDHSAMQHDL